MHEDSHTPWAPPPADLLLSAIVDSSDDAIISKNLNGIVTSWNRGAEIVFGYSKEEAIGKSILMLCPPDREAEEREILDSIKAGTRVDHFETIRRRKDGRLVDVSVTISPIRNGEGKVVGASTIARDIFEQKRSGKDGRLLAAIVSSSEDAIVSKNLHGIITSWNKGAERIFGYSTAEAVGRPILMLVPADRREEEPRILERIRRGERVEHFETLRRRKNGEIFPVALTISPLVDAANIVIGASKIARDISDFKRLSAEREQLLESERVARSQAEYASRMKDEFLATVSHELRTPLNAIVGWTQVVKEAHAAGEDVVQGLNAIERNAIMQAGLIDDLLDLGRISSGKVALNLEELEIGAIVRDAIGTILPSAAAKDITVQTLLNEGRTEIRADKRRLQQVVWNLLTNAVKFTPRNGKVTVTTARVDSQVEITVVDNGRGIAPEFLPHVFERFRQADASTTRQYGGLGIGLAIVKQLVELHGGAVNVESPGLGQGATFVVSLPVMLARREPSRTDTKATGPQLSESDSPAALLGVKVLAVDDDPDSLNVIKRILIARQADVKTASSVKEALAIFGAFLPDVILSDIGMPKQDGYELIRSLRKIPGGQAVPAAALTALARSEDRMMALQAGFQTHLAKPVAPAELLAVVRSLASLQAKR